MKAIQRIKLSKAERDAMNREINKQVAKSIDDLKVSLIAMMLWQLHTQLGFGKKRLMRFYNSFKPEIENLQKYYDFYTGEETDWLYRKELQEIGIDVEELERVIPIEYTIDGK